MKNLGSDSIPGEVIAYFEELRVKLAFRMSLMFLCIFSILSYTRYFESMESFSMMAVATIISACCLLIMKSNDRNYLLVFYIYSICGYIIVAFSLMVYHSRIHLVDVLWLMTVVFLAFFTLGRRLGYILLFLSIMVIGLFIFLHLDHQIRILKALTIYQKISLLIELIAAFSLNFYLFYLFLELNSYSEKKLLESYDQVKEQNTRILLQNEEKTTLVREIHHRVKNNLQIVVSLLRMQSQEVDNPEFRILFQESINRIMAMSLIHQRLYQNDNLSQIRIGDYLDELIREIMNLSITEQTVDYEIKTEVGKIGLKTLIPVGLLINELVANSLKHAFEDVTDARIQIEIQREEDNYLRITYSDNGVWKQQIGNSSFGLVLIDTLIEQLEGTKDVCMQGCGTTYTMVILNLEEKDILA
ncbi:sensor histidine kinase [Fluviicola chungangensis]|uniref:histidine kinase n=1 Tax=Fluviicola chungangensis TaxID=2597671 RepID=A0A556MGT6_9FLAO|nr:sensor histidine kinase [Fluviicola chungangensis]TSJ39098.1 sensor histidine kinase [Fluviicola chungangensis]